MLLLIDIGNTRIKWTMWRDGVLGEQQAMPHAQLSSEQLAASIFAAAPRPERVLVANVAGARMADLVACGVRQQWDLAAEFIESCASAAGVRNAYREPKRLGVDRWLAMLAAYRLAGGAVCVVSIGTAMTIDGVDASGQHLGGLIVPGHTLMVQSLFRSTSDIEQRAHGGAASNAFFADNTLGAVEQGAAHALAALIDRTMDEMTERLGAAPALIVTGGAVALVALAIRRPTRHVPDLVLRGLAVLAED